METTITFVSVVRDSVMYERCIVNNPYVNRHVLKTIDNTIENRGIPFRYNQVLSKYDYKDPTWFVFCHEDFEFQEDVHDKLCSLDKNVLYGPIGAVTKVILRLIHLWQPVGSIMESNKNGANLHRIGREASNLTPVDTFDCSCLIVHSDLIQKHNLRFDEHLSFDLYVEDFCIAAKESHHIPSQILNFDCQHWSGGYAGERFLKQLDYLNNKYTSCCYTSLCAYNIGHPNTIRSFNYLTRKMLRHLFLFSKRTSTRK